MPDPFWIFVYIYLGIGALLLTLIVYDADEPLSPWRAIVFVLIWPLVIFGWFE